MTIFIAGILLAMGISGLCSLLESVLLSLSTSDIATISAKHPKTGEIWSSFKNRIDRPIAVILLVNTTAHTIGASVAGASFNSLYGSEWIWVFSLIFTFLMLQYTEILPKTVGIRFNRRLALVFARPLQWSIRFLSPVITLIRWLNRPFEGKLDSSEKLSTVDELSLMASFARQRRLIGPQQEQIILGATRLSQLSVQELMIPLDEMVVLSDDMSLWEAIEYAHIDAHTRFPVCHGADRNDLRGYVNFKEIIAHQRLNPVATEFHEIIRQVSVVDPNSKASDLLRYFTQQHEHIAVVREEPGKVSGKVVGMVTLEDLVEELVGEIEDEFDRLPRTSHVLPNRVLLLGGGCSIRDVSALINDRLEIPFEIQLGEGQVDKSLALWMEEQLDDSPKRGDAVISQQLRFLVRRIRRGRIFDVQVQKV